MHRSLALLWIFHGLLGSFVSLTSSHSGLWSYSFVLPLVFPVLTPSHFSVTSCFYRLSVLMLRINTHFLLPLLIALVCALKWHLGHRCQSHTFVTIFFSKNSRKAEPSGYGSFQILRPGLIREKKKTISLMDFNSKWGKIIHSFNKANFRNCYNFSSINVVSKVSSLWEKRSPCFHGYLFWRGFNVTENSGSDCILILLITMSRNFKMPKNRNRFLIQWNVKTILKCCPYWILFYFPHLIFFFEVFILSWSPSQQCSFMVGVRQLEAGHALQSNIQKIGSSALNV